MPFRWPYPIGISDRLRRTLRQCSHLSIEPLHARGGRAVATNQLGYGMMASSCASVQHWVLGVRPSMVWNLSPIVSLWRLGTSFDLDSRTIWETPVHAQKWYVLGCFGYHGNLLAFFGFWFLVCCVSSFVRKYSRSGLECPESQSHQEQHYLSNKGFIYAIRSSYKLRYTYNEGYEHSNINGCLFSYYIIIFSCRKGYQTLKLCMQFESQLQK